MIQSVQDISHFLMFPHKNDKDSQCRQIVLEKKTLPDIDKYN